MPVAGVLLTDGMLMMVNELRLSCTPDCALESAPLA